MSYQTGTATDQTDLMSKLSTFAQANGFTEEYYNGTTKFLALSRSTDNIYVTFAWDAINTIAIYQALGFSATYQEQPWNQADDSGGGSDTIPSLIDRGRQVSKIGNGAFTAYHFFAHTDPYCIYVVLEFSPGLYRHFGFGKINKVGTWTGGAFAYGHLWNWGNSFAVYDEPAAQAHTVMMDSLFTHGLTYYETYTPNAGGTLHCEGLPGQDASGKWGMSGYYGVTTENLGTDRGSNPKVRIFSGCRASFALSLFGGFLPDLANGFVPIMPMEVFYSRNQSAANGVYYLGNMHNVGHIHLEGIDPGQEITVGSDTWIAFPMVRKSNIGSNNQETENAGIIYKKVT